ncbi:MAG: sigma factor-like helix-turn-helix DNA-binding protein [Myxococcota bacterium]
MTDSAQSPTYASVLALIDADGASLVETAQQLGISVNTAAVRLHRAREALRRAMREHCGVQNARDCLECRCVFDGCCVA